MASSIQFSGVPASDLLRSSSSVANGVPLRNLARSRLPGARRRSFSAGRVSAKIVKVGKMKHEYPWPDEIDLNPDVKGGVLSYLSEFKPLKERPKPVTLPFEKPLVGLEKKIMDVQKMAAETGLDFTDQIIALESKYEQALKDLYTHLTPIQRVSIARHPNRPTFLDHVFNITEKFVELHGDRAGYDDPAIVTGIGSIEGKSYMFIGHQKGRNTKENIKRNFGMPTPHGYRKALRMMYYADHHGLPIISFIDTPGAYADLKSEELGQGEAIAFNLRTMFGLKVPIVTVVIGEGGSGGALAIGCANKLLMMENAVFYVASPEACAAILWKTSKASPTAAEKLKITATELCKLNIADGIIPEPLGGAHADPSWASQQIKQAVVGAMNELMEMETPELLEHRRLKFRHLGGFIEGEPVDPENKINMMKKDEPEIEQVNLGTTSTLDLEHEVEKLKQQILNPEEDTSFEPVDVGVSELVEKLENDVDQELTMVAESKGLRDKLDMLRSKITNARSSPDQLMDPSLKDKVDKLKKELKEGLQNYPNSERLNQKLNMLKELTMTQKVMPLKQDINKALKEIMDRPDMKEKMDLLKQKLIYTGVSTASDLDDGMKEKILKVKKEIAAELEKTLMSMDVEVEHMSSNPIYSELKEKVLELDQEINGGIQDAINSTGLKDKIETLKLEMEKKVMPLKQDINKALKEIMDRPDMKEKVDLLKQELTYAGVSTASDLDDGMKEKVLKVKKEIAAELEKTLMSMDVEVEQMSSNQIYSELKEKVLELDQEIKRGIQDAINSTDLKDKIEMLKLEKEKAGESPDAETKSKILDMKQEIKSSLAEAMNSPSLIEKYETLKEEITKVSSTNIVEEHSGILDESLTGDVLKDTPTIGLNVGSTSSNS